MCETLLGNAPGSTTGSGVIHVVVHSGCWYMHWFTTLCSVSDSEFGQRNIMHSASATDGKDRTTERHYAVENLVFWEELITCE